MYFVISIYWSLGPLRLTVLECTSNRTEQVLILEPLSHENISSVTSIQVYMYNCHKGAKIIFYFTTKPPSRYVVRHED